MIVGYLQIHSFCDQNGTQQTAYYLCGRVASLVGKQNKNNIYIFFMVTLLLRKLSLSYLYAFIVQTLWWR